MLNTLKTSQLEDNLVNNVHPLVMDKMITMMIKMSLKIAMMRIAMVIQVTLLLLHLDR